MSNNVQPVPTREPARISAGDTAQWTRTFNGYSPAQWTLHYVLRGLTNVYKFDAIADSGAFLATLESATTKDWRPGQYYWGAYLTDLAGNQVSAPTVFTQLQVSPNLAVNPAGADPRSWAVKTLAQLEETIGDLRARRVVAASVNGQSYTLANIEDLFRLRERLLNEVRRERMQERLNAGLGAANKIGIRFRPMNDGQAHTPWR